MQKENYNDNDFNPEKDAHQLNAIGNGNPFKVPDGYFDELPANVISKIAEQKKEKAGSIIKLFRPQIAIAASVVCIGLIAASQLLFNSSQNSTIETNTSTDFFAQLSDEDLGMLEENVLPENLTAEILTTDEIPFDELQDEEAIIDYLIQNNVDVHIIANDL